MTSHHTSEEPRIRALVEDWARAISSGDRKAILAHHAPDVLMFDFPPNIVRGLVGLLLSVTTRSDQLRAT